MYRFFAIVGIGLILLGGILFAMPILRAAPPVAPPPEPGETEGERHE